MRERFRPCCVGSSVLSLSAGRRISRLSPLSITRAAPRVSRRPGKLGRVCWCFCECFIASPRFSWYAPRYKMTTEENENTNQLYGQFSGSALKKSRACKAKWTCSEASISSDQITFHMIISREIICEFENARN